MQTTSPSRLAPGILLAGWLVTGSLAAAPEAVVRPESVDMSTERLDRIDAVVRRAIARNQLPGAVVLIVHRDRIVFRRAYGLRSKQPTEIPMTEDTLFDLASLTKPIATATSLLILLEQGKLSLADRAAQHWPDFGKNGKDRITIEQLLLHTSGLIADNPVADYRDGREQALRRICDLRPRFPVGTRFLYSDVNYIVLGEIVERLASGGAGKRVGLDEFAQRHVFTPLGMTATGFRPAGQLRERAAPTERRDGRWMKGEVHDPRAYLLGGVAGHAGLFSTADDLAIYARMILRRGEYRGRRILSPAAVRTMTTARPVPGGLRAPGWDVRTAFSRNRGTLFARDRGVGHTGFTGTSLWVDPDTDTAVIFLSNRVHPDGKGNVNRLRGQVATLAAAALLTPSPRPRAPVATGLDVLVRSGFRQLRGRKVGLVTNHTGLDREGRSAIDLLHRAEGVKLVALFSPEHGIRGTVDARVPDGKDARTGLPVYSLYGARRKPTADTLRGIDTLVFDIQDAGCRFYTYISTLGLVLEAAREHRLRVVVLDRPNPIGGLEVEGPVLDAGRESFVAYHALPVRHGLTVGELARLFNAERKIGADLEVIRLEGWRRGDLYDATGLTWVNPSPNLRGLTAALLYPGIGLLETTNVSVGRGTERPFEWVGAPWIDGRQLTAALAELGLPGVRFVPVQRTPSASVHKGRDCGGVEIIVADWSRFRPVRTGLAVASTLRRLYPSLWQVERYNVLLGHKATWEGLQRGVPCRELEEGWQPGLKRFLELRRAYLLYKE
jgi:uncharacterized protein YbbC (DUF1343 family)/CubicO group peptidase (beta-lactamase class C family)